MFGRLVGFLEKTGYFKSGLSFSKAASVVSLSERHVLLSEEESKWLGATLSSFVPFLATYSERAIETKVGKQVDRDAFFSAFAFLQKTPAQLLAAANCFVSCFVLERTDSSVEAQQVLYSAALDALDDAEVEEELRAALKAAIKSCNEAAVENLGRSICVHSLLSKSVVRTPAEKPSAVLNVDNFQPEKLTSDETVDVNQLLGELLTFTFTEKEETQFCALCKKVAAAAVAFPFLFGLELVCSLVLFCCRALSSALTSVHRYAFQVLLNGMVYLDLSPVAELLFNDFEDCLLGKLLMLQVVLFSFENHVSLPIDETHPSVQTVLDFDEQKASPAGFEKENFVPRFLASLAQCKVFDLVKRSLDVRIAVYFLVAKAQEMFGEDFYKETYFRNHARSKSVKLFRTTKKESLLLKTVRINIMYYG